MHTILFGHWCCIFCVLVVRKPGSKPLLHKLPNSCTQQWTKIHSDCQVSMCQNFTTFQISKQGPLTSSEDWLSASVHRSAFSSSSEYWWTYSVHQNLFSSKLTLNVAWEHRFKILIVWFCYPGGTCPRQPLTHLNVVRYGPTGCGFRISPRSGYHTGYGLAPLGVALP